MQWSRVFSVMLVMNWWMPFALAEQCDCKVWPFEPDPPCFDRCAALLLLDADIDMLQQKLNLSAEALEQLRNIRQQKSIEEPTSLSEAFAPAVENEIEIRLRALSAEDAKSLLLTTD